MKLASDVLAETQSAETQALPSSLSIPKAEELDPNGDLIAASTILSEISAATANPLLQNLTDYFVDEGNTEEELLLLGELNVVV